MNKKFNAFFWAILLGIFTFHGILENTVPILSVFDECVGLLCIPMAAFDFLKTHKQQASRHTVNRRLQLVFLGLFLLCGLAGNVIYRFQPLWVAAVSAVLSMKFFLILLAAGYLQKYIPITLEEQGRPIAIISILWFLYYGASLLWKNVLIAPEAWDICAKSMLLFALLIFCKQENVWLKRICLALMLLMLIFCGKEKAYGAILVFALLYYLIVYKKVQTKVRYFLYLAVPVALLAWDKIYYYYVEGRGRFAKSIMTTTSFQIAKDYFPIGTGFGTFGSTYAASNYSPVYYLYGIADNPELGVNSKMYLTDQFWPILLGETGILGTVLYGILLLLLFTQIQRIFYYQKKKYFLMIFLYVFLLMTTFSEAGFMQPMVMIYAFVMGILLEEYEEKKNQKLQYFGRKSGDL